jgi:hypothetical protein
MATCVGAKPLLSRDAVGELKIRSRLRKTSVEVEPDYSAATVRRLIALRMEPARI